jgi:magnesium transporter
MQFELTREFLTDLRDALAASDEVRVLELIGDLHAADVAEVLDDLSSQESKVLLQYLDAAKASNAIINLDEEDLKRLLEEYSAAEIAETFIENLDSDDAADVIQELPDDKKEEVIAQLDDFEQAGDIVDLLSYEDGTAGALMGKELVSVNANLSVKQCVVELRRQADEVQHIYTIYVVDNEQRLLGRLSLKRLLVADARSKIANIYVPDIRSVKATESQEDVARLMEKYDLVALPVVDGLGRLIGRITIDDAVDIMKEEAEKDYQMASGISEDIESTDSVWVLTRGRLPWLLLGLLGGILGARVIGNYEEDLQLYPEMAFFIPLVAAMAGNVGVQSSAIVVKGLANNTLGLGGMTQKLGKEFAVGLINALVCSLIVLMYNVVTGSSLDLSYTVSLALVTVIVFAALFGTFVPLVLDKYKIDPALATGPFITTVNDITGLFIYFAIGRMLYGM